jgi:hypothetical protein
VFSSGAQTSSTGVYFIINDSTTNDISVGFRSSNRGGLLVDNNPIDDNIWNNIVLTSDNINFIVYKNGTSIKSSVIVNTNGGQNMSLIDFTLGTPNNSKGNFEFVGSIASVQVYNRALTSDEVLQNYNAQKGRFGL